MPGKAGMHGKYVVTRMFRGPLRPLVTGGQFGLRTDGVSSKFFRKNDIRAKAGWDKTSRNA
jgi:hypothetical protein